MNQESFNFAQNRHPDESVLKSFAAGLVEDEETNLSIEQHVAGCPDCARFLAELIPSSTERLIAEWAATLDKPVKAQVSRYEIIEEIGRGGSGVVYRARQAGLNRLLALKVLISGSNASSAELVRFRREAQALAFLDHPQIVQVHDFGEQNGAPFLALELVDGPTLARYLERGPIQPQQIALWVRELARAIDCAHQRSIFHRDLKPQNILLAQSDTGTDNAHFIPKIVDFGLARFETDSLFHTRTGETLGTPAYLAPEMIETKRHDNSCNPGNAAVDVYGLGTILYEGLTGRPPFIGSSHLEILTAVAQNEPPSIQVLRNTVPRDLAIICHRCLAKNPSQRFASAAELADDLDRFLSGEPIVSRAVSSTERMIRWCRRNPWKAIAGALAGLVLAVIPAAGFYHARQLGLEKRTAQARYESTRETLWEMLHLLNTNQAASIPQLAELSSNQLEQALALFDELATADPTDRSRLDLAKAEVLTATLAIVLGKRAEAESHLKQAIRICNELEQQSQVVEEAMEQRAAALNKLAVNSVEPSQAVGYMEQALELHRKLADQNPIDDPTSRGRIAWSLMNLGATLQVQGQLDQAVGAYQEAIQIWDSLVAGDFNLAESKQAAAGTRINLASIQLGQGDLELAEMNFQVALEAYEHLVANSPDDHSLVEDLTSGLLNYSNCLFARERVDDAVAACSRAKELLIGALKLEPNRARLKENLFLVTANRANLLRGANRNELAANDWREAVGLTSDPAMQTYCRQHCAICLARTGEVDAAQVEISLIDESALKADEKFLQAICRALLAKARGRQEIASNSSIDLIEHDLSCAWSLLAELSSSGHLADEGLRAHLETSEDWSELRRVYSSEKIIELIQQPSGR